MNELRKRFPVYSRLLRLYPAEYRQQYGEQMLQTLADMLDNNPSVAHRMLVWLRLVLDVPVSLLAQQLSFAGNALVHETPGFVRRNAFVSLLTFAPFFAFVTISSLDQHRLEHTWLWSFHVLFTWIVLLPALGVALSVVTLAVWMRTCRRPFWRNLRDIRHNWLMLLPIAFGLGLLCLVFFHDSVHCVTGNPIRELHNPRDTLQCIEQR